MNINTTQWRMARSRHQDVGVPGSPATCLVVARGPGIVCVLIEGYHSRNFKVWFRGAFNKNWIIDPRLPVDTTWLA